MTPLKRRPKHELAEHDVAPVSDAAPIDADPDAPETLAEQPAPIYPTEADEIEATAAVLKHDPHLSRHALARAVGKHLAENASRAVKRRQAAAASLTDERAVVFPTETHVLDLREAIPTLSDEESDAILRAGYGAFLASIDAHEPVLTPATEE